jgi:DNA-binding transcriptional LysR family regulator
MVLGRNDIQDLSVFLLIVRYRSFRKAADQLGVTVSALSHRMKALEIRLGVRLLNRTSRSVSPTVAGAALAEKVDAGLELIYDGIEDLRGHSTGLAASVRINVLRDAVPLLLGEVLPAFRQQYPNIQLEIAADDHFVDVTAQGFDAGLRYAGSIPEDMISVTVTPPLMWVAVASPSYLAAAGLPQRPHDLLAHNCIRIRTGRGQLYHWEFDCGDEHIELDVPGSLISGSTDVAITAAVAGVGVAYCLRKLADPYLNAGQLRVVLPEWSSPGPPLAFYYSGRRQVPYGLKMLIRVIRALNHLETHPR